MMRIETSTCQNCKSQFAIDPEDFAFYEKMKVPPPTWCPECRLIRRLTFYNKRALYKRKCGSCGSETFSMYDAASPYTMYCNKCWWSDNWDPLKYGQDYDFLKPFFPQLQELALKVPQMALGRDESSLVNSSYTNAAGNLKDCYLVFLADYVENSYYCDTITNSKDCFDCLSAYQCEQCYDSVNITKCFKVFYSVDCEDCHDILFSRNLTGCSCCIGCVNLRNKQYCIFNEQYTKEEYEAKVKELSLGSAVRVAHATQQVERFLQTYPRKYFHGRHNVNVSGDYVNYSKNTSHSFFADNAEDSKYCFLVYGGPTKDSCDYSIYGENASRVYEAVKCGYGVSDIMFCSGVWSSARDCRYSSSCMTSSDLFGCVGVRNKQYCILNKQYTKEEYEKLVPRIIEHMNADLYRDAQGRTYAYGEFFPLEMAHFAYNDSLAQEHFPLSKTEAERKGYVWKDSEGKQFVVTKKSSQLPDDIKSANKSILDEIMGCEHEAMCNEQCTKAFKIISAELEFYKKMNVPLPKLCPNCRHYQRTKKRNPLKLFQRSCMCAGVKSDGDVYSNQSEHFHKEAHCPNEFETAYSPEGKGVIYCERCYQDELM